MRRRDRSAGTGLAAGVVTRERYRRGIRSGVDEIIELYKKDVDQTLLIENLRLTPEQRFEKFARVMEGVMELRRAGAEARRLRRETAGRDEGDEVGR